MEAIIFLRVGAARKHDDQLIKAVITHNTMVPTMKLTCRDPDIEDPVKGPKRRALANEGPNVRVYNIVAKILNTAADMEGLQAKVEVES